MEFKVNDRVKIRKDSRYYTDFSFNPKEHPGTISEISSSSPWILVKWDNGSTNGYLPTDLELIKPVPVDNYEIF